MILVWKPMYETAKLPVFESMLKINFPSTSVIVLVLFEVVIVANGSALLFESVTIPLIWTCACMLSVKSKVNKQNSLIENYIDSKTKNMSFKYAKIRIKKSVW